MYMGQKVGSTGQKKILKEVKKKQLLKRTTLLLMQVVDLKCSD